MDRRLSELSVGDRGRVRGFARNGPRAYRQRLMAMGLVTNTSFRVIRVAPMGDPVEIQVRDYSLSLRKDEATALIVEEL